MKKLAAAAALLMLAGCANAPKPPVTQPPIVHKAPAKKAANPVEATTPNQIVKKRWYDRFKVHPKWFNSK